MSEDQLRALLGDLSAVQLGLWAFAFMAIAFFVVKMWPWLNRFVATVNALADLPSKLGTIAGIEQKVVRIEAQVKDIHHETHFNSGTSIKDATVRIENKVDAMQSLMENGDADLDTRVRTIERAMNFERNTDE
ncbi:hypothetical protein [Leucobacter luti]|uniref:hypothetical protein n=1 Tax=Leucobacter luti TaxID=340320 RepID=UPI001C692BE6|nr:hypothetical protein [Leucobacter luti]QYM76181.1 hypothetical protein K1X41_01435 [Leucobacter luti]